MHNRGLVPEASPCDKSPSVCLALRKSKIGFGRRKKESGSGFCVSLLSNLIQDHSDHGALKETNNPLLEMDSSVPWTHHDPRDFGLYCL